MEATRPIRDTRNAPEWTMINRLRDIPLCCILLAIYVCAIIIFILVMNPDQNKSSLIKEGVYNQTRPGVRTPTRIGK
jgi:hypothetical protein